MLISYLNCLAGGVVLGALLMHMIPEMSHSGHHHQDKPKKFLEKKHSHSNETHPRGLHVTDVGRLAGPREEKYRHRVYSELDLQDDHVMDSSHHGHQHEHKGHGSSAKAHAESGCPGFSWSHFTSGCSFLLLLAIDRLVMHTHAHDHDHKQHDPMQERSSRLALTTDMDPASPSNDVECCRKVHMPEPEVDDCASCHSDDLVGGCHMDGLESTSSKPQALAFVLALSLHSFLEGLGMASQEDARSLSLYLLSLFAHKWLEAFALGVNVMNASFSPTFAFILIVFYALLTPLGIILGLISVSLPINPSAAGILRSCLNGAAVGSFLFVSCIEMIPPEFHKRTSQTPWKFLVLSTGFLCMALVSVFHQH